jgi:Tol biopolymer transport system component
MLGPFGTSAARASSGVARWTVALVGVGVLAGCAPARPVAARGGDGSGLPPSHASAGAAAAELFAPGVISDAKRQWRITFTADGRTAYFAESEGFFPATRQATIHVTRRVDGAWTEPEVAPFSGRYSDIDPFVTPDGSRLYFSSIRPVDGVLRGDVDIWYVERTPAGWGEARRLGAEVNGPTDELYASASADGDLYFAVGPAAPTPDDDWNIHRAARSGRGFAPRQPVAALNTDLPFDPRDPTADWEFNPEVSADGRALVFTSLRPGGHGQGDLYVSHHREGAWSAPRNLGPAVNTRFDEFHPTLARDGFLYFVRNSSTATHGDIYRIAAGAVDPLRPGARAGGRR